MNPQPPYPRQPYPQQPPPSAAHPAARAPMSNGLGTAGFVLGLVGLLFSFIPIIGVVAWPLTIVGLVLAILGFNRTRNGRADNRGLAIAGIVLSALGLVVCVLYAAVFTAAVGDAAARSGGSAASASGGDTAPVAFGQAVTVADMTYAVSVPAKFTPSSSAAAAGPIARALKVDITITNNGSTPFDFNPFAVGAKASAAGVPAPEITDFAERIGVTRSSTVLPGKSITYPVAFAVPAKAGDFQVEVSPSMFGSRLIFTGTA